MIVNAANDRLSHAGGIAGIISDAAGYELQQDCDRRVQLQGNLRTG